MDQPVRKRGRPQITKEYSNPLESPMAHSSMKVQKLGPSKFSRPMMKVGQVTPSPRIRRTSSSSGTGNGEPLLSGPGSTAKGRYRGVLLTTPTKRPALNRSSTSSSVSPSSDSIFHSSSKLSLKSSPPVVTWNESEDKVLDDGFQQFKFALTIGENGRATIAGSSPLSTPTKEAPAETTTRSHAEQSGEGSQHTISASEKSRVLSLLKQMRNSTSSQRKSSAGEVSRTFNALSDKTQNESSMSSIIKSPQAPSTPRTSFTMRTGFTPNTGIDQVLLDIVSTPKAGLYGGSEQTGSLAPSSIITISPKGKLPARRNLDGRAQQDRQQYVFKFSSADPLLLTDDVEGNWAEVMYNQSQGSPKQQLCFNTPPSWVNWGSPRAFSPQRQDSNTVYISAFQGTNIDKTRALRTQDSTIGASPSNRREQASIKSPSNIGAIGKTMGEPSTPKFYDVPVTSAVGCTPLIQQTMNGSLTAKYVPALLNASQTADTTADQEKPVSMGTEQEDARVALKRLVADR